MRDLAALTIHLLVTIARLVGPGGARSVIAESLLVKHQLLILNRSRTRAPALHPADRIFAGLTSILMHPTRLMRSAIVLKPSTILRFHKALVKRNGSGGPSWLTFLGHSKDSLWSVELFRCESIFLRSHWVMVVMDQYSRRIIGFAVHAGTVDGPTLCNMFNRTITGIALPRRLSSDNDPLFTFHRWQANLRILDVMEVKSVQCVPLSHPFIERLIGTVRREFLDHVPFWGTADLDRKLEHFREYYNTNRTQRSLDGTPPAAISKNPNSSTVRLDNFRWNMCCRGLYQLPAAA